MFAEPAFQTINIPRVSRPPKLEEFLTMEPAPYWRGKLAKVDQFTQRVPSDGAPASQRTEAYLGYDDKNLYAIFICFDSERQKTRARLSRREDIFDDDTVEIILDTFYDHRHAYAFNVNPLGVQQDALWTEGPGTGNDNFDQSFDTVWNSSGKLTSRGYVVWIAIPFRSLRFASADPKTWGIFLNRGIPRNNEDTFWPPYSTRIQGRLNQEGTATGFQGISPGRNIQLIPYGLFRSFKEINLNDPNNPAFSQRTAFGQAGLDAKVVLKDKFVLDLTANPDFSQIESEQPQVTVNQRFEVFFPELRPFFQENSNYFQTPINLAFTRRIVDPKWGVRLTGKDGPWAIGMLVADTASPSEEVTTTNPLYGHHALFSIARVSYDLGAQSHIAAMYADREVAGFFNRVGSLDGRVKLDDHWAASVQGAYSATVNPYDPLYDQFSTTGTNQTGTAAEAIVRREGRSLNYVADYSDRSPNFRTLTGFDPQPDIRSIDQVAKYVFHPEGKYLITWGPVLENWENYDHEGNHLNSGFFPAMKVELTGQTFLTAAFAAEMERLRNQDYSEIPVGDIQKYVRHTTEFTFNTNYFKKFYLQADYRFGTRVNYDSPCLAANDNPATCPSYFPFLAKRTSANATLTIRPTRSLRIDNTYILFRLRQCPSCWNPQPELPRPFGSMNNDIIRSKWNYQFTKEFSFRFIGQYSAVLANPNFTYLQTSKNFNADFLFTYLVHPNTALYVGYNTNLENVGLPLEADGLGGINHDPTAPLRNDGRNFFVKASYLFRF
ncbi:MAG TPA: DUF5916 domain-containing protein [Terriglobales bacterium]|nr:DUF5916 domain-containing protein [Terriglobales bacterium]